MPHYNGLTKLSILVCILTDISSHVRQFYGSFNNVIVKGRETWTLNDQSINRVNVAQNNSFRHYFLEILEGNCQTIAIHVLLSNFIDFVFYRPKKTAVLEEIGYA